MENYDVNYKELDLLVVPIVKFFNENGLPTYMSCQGHNNTNKSMFWVQFTNTVTEEDILRFMQQRVSCYGTFCSHGRFAKRVYGFYSAIDGTWKKTESWNYFAATVEAADSDLQKWKSIETTQYAKAVGTMDGNHCAE